MKLASDLKRKLQILGVIVWVAAVLLVAVALAYWVGTQA